MRLRGLLTLLSLGMTSLQADSERWGRLIRERKITVE